MDDLSLGTRQQMPEGLRALLAEFPRDGWERHRHFAGLVQFWLERHMMFRQLRTVMQQDVEAAMDKKMPGREQASRLSRFGGMMVSQLHGHHQIEDAHYFPVLGRMEPKLGKGFDILDADHHAMDGLLNRFTESANAVLQGKGELGTFRQELLSFGTLLERHLEDEEDLIVPVILRHGPGKLE
ncbi:hemerythrin domain-containing protein [Puniceibacterium sp. IMCC21224]|uniref:hemerythrin domain-containing protein n=1 Tax=Puniceibacterium sp. IMCC21224 TaxID=1618204 RepID=UPI00064DA382|nr:hemerythrin domain-containing protein [Puniceibacterium sp. IMCC21224]KMK66373.1 hemerythrin HHE cation binding domain-containing protein [Puniceibacterium sp. IMCC21224]